MVGRSPSRALPSGETQPSFAGPNGRGPPMKTRLRPRPAFAQAILPLEALNAELNQNLNFLESPPPPVTTTWIARSREESWPRKTATLTEAAERE